MRHRMGMAIAAVCILGLLAFVPSGRAASDEYGDTGDAGDPEGISPASVARLRVDEGSAWLLAPGETDWQEIEGNAPMPGGSRIRVPDDAFAYVEFSGGSKVRLSGGADLELRALREDRIGMTLHEGDAAFLLPADDFLVPINVVLPDGQVVRLAVPGRYRIEAAPSGEKSLVQVPKGEARIKVSEGKFRVREGEEATVGAGVSIGRLTESRDEFSEAPPPEMTPVERSVEAPPSVVYELNDYGDWVDVPAYGAVWRPRVAAGWSPYYYGHWSWVAGFGWCWVSDEPWGWYPYRCGYWFSDPTFGWCWTPYRAFVGFSWTGGHRHYRPAWYYPATVRFVRESGNVRWIPLRPGERFSRPAIPRTERSLGAWRQPLPRQTVFERARGSRAGGAPQWRDARGDRPVRKPSVRPAPVVRPAPLIRPAPVERRPGLQSTPSGQSPRVRPMPTDRRRDEGATPRVAPREPSVERSPRNRSTMPAGELPPIRRVEPGAPRSAPGWVEPRPAPAPRVLAPSPAPERRVVEPPRQERPVAPRMEAPPDRGGREPAPQREMRGDDRLQPDRGDRGGRGGR